MPFVHTKLGRLLALRCFLMTLYLLGKTYMDFCDRIVILFCPVLRGTSCLYLVTYYH